jgi:predicted transcriptional regulator
MTHIMFRCNLNSMQLHQYLRFLVEKDLVDHQPDPLSSKLVYKTTELGRGYMRAYEALFELVGPRDFARVQVKA